ncbi:MAG: hypothetical protein IPN53_15190 [Comamonadaceae bacterium]|nr:hypothetical protein [Comamonadaceae bacterium]
MSQSGFAKRIGVSSKAVEGWEAGASLPSGTSLLRMREAFGADINVILTGQTGGAAPANRPDEDELLAHYRAAHSDARERIRQIAATAANSPKRGEIKEKKPKTGIRVGTLHGQYIEGDITNHGGMSFGAPPPTPPPAGKPATPKQK